MVVHEEQRNRKSEKSIRWTLLQSNILIILIPSLILFSFLFFRLTTDARIAINREKLVSLEQYSSNLNKLYRDVLYLSNNIAMDPTINAYVSKKHFSQAYEAIAAKNEILRRLGLLANIFNDERYSINILGYNGQVYFQDESFLHSSNVHLEDLESETWFSRVLEANGALLYLSRNESAALSSTFPQTSAFAVRLMKNLNSGRNIGLIIIGIEEKTILRTIWEGVENVDLFVVDSTGSVFVATSQRNRSLDIASFDRERNIFAFDRGYFLTSVDGIGMQLYFATNTYTSWKLITMIAEKPQWPSYIRYVFAISFVLLLLVMIKTSWNANFLSRRMNRIIDSINALDLEHFTGRVPDTLDAEFRDFITAFNATLDKISLLAQELERNEQEKHQLEIQALQFQINPHFLYNTIASIRFMVQMGQYEASDTALRELVSLLKGIFSNQGTLASLADEFEVIRQYMVIMQHRFQDTFNFSLMIEPGLEQCTIIKFVLQPLVENCITHGFHDIDHMGHITVAAKRAGADLLILVEDNGHGGSIETINTLIETSERIFQTDGLTGFGIRNVQQRIRKQYGETYGIQAYQNENPGVTISLIIPLMSKEDDNGNSLG